jgi:hypothetical protein
MRRSTVCFLLLVVTAELAASLAVWHGTPTDWSGDPLHFWSYELLRLRYWLGFAFVAGVLWNLGRVAARQHFSKLASSLLAIACALATEAATSLSFWSSLSLSQVGFLGWPNCHRYLWEHLVSWSLAFSALVLLSWFWRKSHRAVQL